MIVWINGASGAGKRAAARELVELLPHSTLFDPGAVGESLALLLPPQRLAAVGDVQELPIWRRLMVDAAAAVLAEMGGDLVVPMTLLRQEYRDEIFGGLAARRIPVRHIALTPAETILRARIAGRGAHPGATGIAASAGARAHGEGGAGGATRVRGDGSVRTRRGSRLRVQRGGEERHLEAVPRGPIEPFRAALADWLAADAHLLDTSELTPYETAERIAEAVRTEAAAVCDIVQSPEPTAETLASGVLLFDDEDRVLLVDPTYKAGWEFPGGVVEPGEAPARAGIREVAEETGIRLDRVPRLLVVDWEAPAPPSFGGLRLLFDGGRLAGRAADEVLLPGSELRDWRFVTEREAADMLPPVRYERLRWALRARERGEPIYLEAGEPV
ncbi:NUDIX domain-containing protein [Streptomyces sp. NPDC050560]|uniref:NUDIX hydrolase n=1 Tax=Streptomyces sp. NPDC050560 TaxID=3365630 RepID=UPI0037A8D059